MYRLLLHPNIEKQLAKIPTAFATRLVQAMRALKKDPRLEQAKQLDQEMYRLRVGEYCIVYAVFDKEQVVFVGKVARRSEKVYRDVTQILARVRAEVGKEQGKKT